MLQSLPATYYARTVGIGVVIALAQFATASEPRIAEVRGPQRVLLDRLAAAVDQEQYEDALELIVRLLQSDSPGVVPVGEGLYLDLPEHCQRTLAKLPAKMLFQYRQQVDATAAQWYREAIANRDSRKLQRLLDQMFCSSWGDDALLALGELALERGDYQTARTAWQRIETAYPDTNLDLAMIGARLTLISIREGDLERARIELASSRIKHPAAHGRMAGRDVDFADHLAALLTQAENTQSANAASRDYRKRWSRQLETRATRERVHPLVVGDLLIFQDDSGVHAARLKTGEPALVDDGIVLSADSVGESPWFRLAATERYVFGATRNSLWGIDLNRDGALFFQREPEHSRTTLASPPVIDGSRVLVQLRSGVRSTSASAACYDIFAQRLLWEQPLCRLNVSDSHAPANELAVDSGIVYASTNLGVVAALRAWDGRILWLHTYHRESSEVPRSPTKLVVCRGVLTVTPTDSSEAFALDATTGRRLENTKKPNLAACGLAQNNYHLETNANELTVFDATQTPTSSTNPSTPTPSENPR